MSFSDVAQMQQHDERHNLTFPQRAQFLEFQPKMQPKSKETIAVLPNTTGIWAKIHSKTSRRFEIIQSESNQWTGRHWFSIEEDAGEQMIEYSIIKMDKTIWTASL